MGVVEDGEGTELSHVFAIGDLECLDDVEGPVGGCCFSVDVFAVRGYKSGRDLVDGKLDLASAGEQIRTPCATNGSKRGVGVGTWDDLDLIEQHAGGLDVPEPCQHRTCLKQ